MAFGRRGEVGRRRRWGVLRSSGRKGGIWGVLRSSGPENRRWWGSSFFGPGRSKNLPIFKEVAPPLPVFRPIFEPILQDRRSKMGGSSISGAEDRRSKIGGSSIFRLRKSKMGFFVLRPRRSKNPTPIFDLRSRKIEESLHLRSSAPKIEELPPIFVLRHQRSKNLLSSFSDPEDQKTARHLRYSEPKIGSKVRSHEPRRARLPPASSRTIQNVSSSARTKEILCKPIEEQKQRSSSGLFAGSRALFDSGRRAEYD